jgi:ribosomal protein S18 acetylase RimI-like enzyme
VAATRAAPAQQAEAQATRPARRGELGAVSAFIVDNFFCDGEPAGLLARASLCTQQEQDLRKRYWRPLHDAQLLILRSRSGALLGCCGFESLPFDGSSLLQPGECASASGDYTLRPLVSNLVVDRTTRGNGYGSALMDAIESCINERGFDESLLLVASQNQGARKFYSKRGYRAFAKATYGGLELENKRFVTQNGIPGVYMRKSLKGGLLGLLGL